LRGLIQMDYYILETDGDIWETTKKRTATDT
jgi:hypothetical protein